MRPTLEDTWREVGKYLDEVLGLETEARQAWLENLEARTPDIAARVRPFLLDLVKLDEQNFLEGSAVIMLATTGLEGQCFGAYTLERALGHGGTGTVWLAKRSDGRFEGHAAVKILNTALAGHPSEKRFVREGSVLASLRHPNIAQLLDAGVTADSQPYLVLEYIRGECIDRYCEARNLSIEQRVTLFLDVLAAVAHAHSNLIIHRDLKPANILVSEDGVVKLLDFGVASLLSSPTDGEGAPLTRHVATGLTPGYAAPEQLRDAAVTTATDVYSLGLVLFVLLTGRHPLSPTENTSSELVRLTLETEVPRPSEIATDPRRRRLLRGDLDNIVAMALRKDPAKRYTSVDPFAQDLRRYLSIEPVLASPPSFRYFAAKFVRRHRLAVAIGGAALIAITGTAAIAMFEAHTSAMHARAVAVERDRVLALSTRTEAVADFLDLLMNDSVLADKPVTLTSLLARSEALARMEYRDNPERRAAVLEMLGMYFHSSGNDSRAEPLLHEALDALIMSRDDDLRRRVTCGHALTMAALGSVTEAKRILHGVIDDPQTATQTSAYCLGRLTYIAQDEGDAAGALQFGKLALQRQRQGGHPSELEEGRYLSNMGFAEYLEGHNSSAEQFYRQALARFAGAGRDRGSEAIAVRNNRANVSNAAGNPRRALELYDETLQIVTQKDSSAPPPLYLVGNRARALEAIGRYGEAHEAYSQCVDLSEKHGKPDHRLYCLAGLASVASELGDLATATSYLDAASQVSSTSVPSGSPSIVRLWNIRGQIALAKSRFEEARKSLDAAVAAAPGSPQSMMSPLLSRAELNLAVGLSAAAQSDARQALSYAQAGQGDLQYSDRTGRAWLVLGQVLAKQADAPRARQAFEAAVTNLSETVAADHPKLLASRELLEKLPAAPSPKNGG